MTLMTDIHSAMEKLDTDRAKEAFANIDVLLKQAKEVGFIEHFVGVMEAVKSIGELCELANKVMRPAVDAAI